MMRPFLLFCLSPLLWWGCHPSASRQVTTTDEHLIDIPDEVLIRLHKGSCYGKCPTYQLSLYRSGQVILTPRRFMPVDTVQTAMWPMEEILAAFESARFDSLAPEYMQPVADIPTFRLSYKDYEVRWNSQAPPRLVNLVALLDRYTVQEGWLEAERAFRPVPSSRISSELIIQLKPGTDLPLWLSLYQDVGMELLRKIVPSGDYILVTFDPESVEPEALLERVRADNQVVLASFNKEVDTRR